VKGKSSWAIFWALLAVFVIIVCFFLIPPFGDLLAGSELFLIPFALFFLLGIALIVLTLKEKVAGILKKFFLLTGASATGVLVFILLHNVIYALFIYFFGEGFWNGGDEPFFFIMATLVCPLAFLVGAVGSIVLGFKNYRLAKKLPPSPQQS
jgi:hypothetical protein